MKAVILAGGMGTRIAEESHLRPKPMIEIGGRPILWHVMNIYTTYGVTDFVICLGYRGYMIKEYFANYVMHESDLTVDARTSEIIYHTNYAEPWRVTLVDTGLTTMTGGRLKRVGRYLDPDESFLHDLRRRRGRYRHWRADRVPRAAWQAGNRDCRDATRPLRGASAAERPGDPISTRSRPATTR